MGKLHLRITNNGPDALQAAPVTVDCGGVMTDLTSGVSSRIPNTSQGTFDITIAPGQTHEFPTQIDLDLNRFKYSFSCEVSAASGAFTDPAPGNNVYSEHIELQPQVHLIQADLAVTDIFADSQGDVYCRITNHGPDALQNATVHLYTAITPLPEWLIGTVLFNNSLTVTLHAGKTDEFYTGFSLISTTYTNLTQFNCLIDLPVLDPNTSNNRYWEIIEAPPQVHLIRADLAVTDIFPDSLPDGEVYCRITNNGPNALQNATVRLYTHGVQHDKASGLVTPLSWMSILTVTLQAEQTREFPTHVYIDIDFYWYELTCQVTIPLDPNPNNDSHFEQIGSPP